MGVYYHRSLLPSRAFLQFFVHFAKISPVKRWSSFKSLLKIENGWAGPSVLHDLTLTDVPEGRKVHFCEKKRRIPLRFDKTRFSSGCR